MKKALTFIMMAVIIVSFSGCLETISGWIPEPSDPEIKPPIEKPEPEPEPEPPGKSHKEITDWIRSTEVLGRHPVSQWMRVEFKDGHAIEFPLHHASDHWGDPGTGYGKKFLPDGTETHFKANIDLRHGALNNPKIRRLGSNPLAPGWPELPDIHYPDGWTYWFTNDDQIHGKKMRINKGLDIYAIRVVVGLAESKLGIDSEISAVKSLKVIWK